MGRMCGEANNLGGRALFTHHWMAPARSGAKAINQAGIEAAQARADQAHRDLAHACGLQEDPALNDSNLPPGQHGSARLVSFSEAVKDAYTEVIAGVKFKPLDQAATKADQAYNDLANACGLQEDPAARVRLVSLSQAVKDAYEEVLVATARANRDAGVLASTWPRCATATDDEHTSEIAALEQINRTFEADAARPKYVLRFRCAVVDC